MQPDVSVERRTMEPIVDTVVHGLKVIYQREDVLVAH